MRIVLVAHDRYPIAEPFAGGLESFVWHLAKRLRQRGHHVTLFAGPGSDPCLCAEELRVTPWQLSELARADVAMLPERAVEETFAYLELMQQLARRDDVDVVHNNSLHYLPIALSDLLSAPVLTSLHTPPTPWMEPALRRLGEAAHVVAVSRATARQWRGIVEPTIIHNGVDLDQWSVGDGGDALVWMGRIVPEKSPHLAAMAAKRAGRSLRIAGPLTDRRYFDEAYVGYGGEDTDFGQRLAAAGGQMWWTARAGVFHQWHPVSRPPVEHVDDVVTNANLFHARWGWYPMTGWLEEFEAMGLVELGAEGWARKAGCVERTPLEPGGRP